MDDVDVRALRPERLHRLTAADFETLVAAGAFDDSPRHVELLRGLLVEMSVQGEPHARISAWFHEELIRALDRSYEVRGHTSFRATEDSVPEPDVQVVVRALRIQLPKEASLAIEVADTSIDKDRGIKAAIYGQSGVPEYWVVDICNEVVHVHTGPVTLEASTWGYRHIEVISAGGVLRPVALPGVELRVSDIPWNPKRND